jgi:plastocyanin
VACSATVAVAVAVAPSLGASADRSGGGARVHQVVIHGMQYLPETVKAKRGDVIVWVNKDPFPHTATARGEFDSGSIAAGKSWRYTVVGGPGVQPYVCTLHSNMKAAVEVE